MSRSSPAVRLRVDDEMLTDATNAEGILERTAAARAGARAVEFAESAWRTSIVRRLTHPIARQVADSEPGTAAQLAGWTVLVAAAVFRLLAGFGDPLLRTAHVVAWLAIAAFGLLLVAASVPIARAWPSWSARFAADVRISRSLKAPRVCAAVAGALVGALYVLSPMAVWFGVATISLIACASLGLPRRERRWVTGVLTTAVVVRAVALAVLFMYLSHPEWATRDAHFILDGDLASTSVFGDEAYYKLRTLWMRDVWLDIPIEPTRSYWAFTRSFGWSGYNHLLAYLQLWVGPAPYGIHLFNAVLYLSGTVLLFRFARRAVGPVAAVGGLILLLFLPTLFVWSISALREPPFFLSCVLAVVGAGSALTASTLVRRAAWALSAGAALALMQTLRPQVMPVTAVALLIGAVVAIGSRTPRRTLALTLAVLLAVAAGATRPDVRRQAMAQIRNGAHQHLGHVFMPGTGYRVLPERFYTSGRDVYWAGHDAIDTMTWSEATAYVFWALVTFVAVPLPWRAGTPSALAIVPQQVVWYILIAALPLGMANAWRREPTVTAMLMVFFVLLSAAVALTNGNVGTLVRHRDGIVPFVVWFGACGVLSWIQNAAGAPAVEEHAARR